MHLCERVHRQLVQGNVEERAFQVLLSGDPRDRGGSVDKAASEQHAQVKQREQAFSDGTTGQSLDYEAEAHPSRESRGHTADDSRLVKASFWEATREREGADAGQGNDTQATCRHLWPYCPPSWGGLPAEWAAVVQSSGAIKSESADLFAGVDLVVYNSKSAGKGQPGGGRVDARRLGAFDLTRKGHYIIGRDAKCCDVVMRHPSISRRHAVLQWRSSDGACLLYDLASPRGTFVRTSQHPLRHDASQGWDPGKRVPPGTYVPLHIAGVGDSGGRGEKPGSVAGASWLLLGSCNSVCRLEVRCRRQDMPLVPESAPQVPAGRGRSPEGLEDSPGWDRRAERAREVQGEEGAEASGARVGGDDDDSNDLMRMWNEMRGSEGSEAMGRRRETHGGGSGLGSRSCSRSASSGSGSGSSPAPSSGADSEHDGGSRVMGIRSGDEGGGTDSIKARKMERKLVNLALSLKAHEVALTNQQEQELGGMQRLVSAIARTNTVLAGLRRDVRCACNFRVRVCACAHKRGRSSCCCALADLPVQRTRAQRACDAPMPDSRCCGGVFSSDAGGRPQGAHAHALTRTSAPPRRSYVDL